jgi:hypothetical protein
MAHLLILLPRWLEIYDYGLRNGLRRKELIEEQRA